MYQSHRQFGTVEQELCNDLKVIVIQASQSGQTVHYAFDLSAYCRMSQPTSQSDTLKLVAPTYNCQTGAITFHSTGGDGDGSPIEYSAAGVTDWTTNPDQLIEQTTVEKAGQSERQHFDLRQQAVGALLLHTTVNNQFRTTKFIKQ